MFRLTVFAVGDYDHPIAGFNDTGDAWSFMYGEEFTDFAIHKKHDKAYFMYVARERNSMTHKAGFFQWAGGA